MALKHKIIDEITLVDYPSMSEQDWTQACDDLLASLPQLEQEIATSPLKGLDFVKLVEQRLIKISEVPQALSCLHDPHQTPFTTKLIEHLFESGRKQKFTCFSLRILAWLTGFFLVVQGLFLEF